MSWQLLAILGGLALVAIVIKFLSLDRILDWFRDSQNLKGTDRVNLAFSVRKHLSNGNYGVVQGVFNQQTNQVLEAKKYDAEDVCNEVKYGDPILTYN
jgi:hypothetical protein